jgi:excisionase family DNA binding protein
MEEGEIVKKRLNILVVDDDVSIRELFERILRKEEHRVVTVSNGEEAIKVIGKENFDIVFLDVVMPEMDGVEVFKEIKKINSQAIVIMMSGYPVEERIREAIKLGATDQIEKPLNADRILTITQVAEYLNIRKLTVYKLAREGGLPAFKVGGQWRFKKELLDKWIARETERSKLSKQSKKVDR